MPALVLSEDAPVSSRQLDGQDGSHWLVTRFTTVTLSGRSSSGRWGDDGNDEEEENIRRNRPTSKPLTEKLLEIRSFRRQDWLELPNYSMQSWPTYLWLCVTTLCRLPRIPCPSCVNICKRFMQLSLTLVKFMVQFCDQPMPYQHI